MGAVGGRMAARYFGLRANARARGWRAWLWHHHRRNVILESKCQAPWLVNGIRRITA